MFPLLKEPQPNSVPFRNKHIHNLRLPNQYNFARQPQLQPRPQSRESIMPIKENDIEDFVIHRIAIILALCFKTNPVNIEKSLYPRAKEYFKHMYQSKTGIIRINPMDLISDVRKAYLDYCDSKNKDIFIKTLRNIRVLQGRGTESLGSRMPILGKIRLLTYHYVADLLYNKITCLNIDDYLGDIDRLKKIIIETETYNNPDSKIITSNRSRQRTMSRNPNPFISMAESKPKKKTKSSRRKAIADTIRELRNRFRNRGKQKMGGRKTLKKKSRR